LYSGWKKWAISNTVEADRDRIRSTGEPFRRLSRLLRWTTEAAHKPRQLHACAWDIRVLWRVPLPLHLFEICVEALNGKAVDWMEQVSDQQYQLGARSWSLVICYQLFVNRYRTEENKENDGKSWNADS